MPTLRWLTRDDDVKAADAVPYRLLEEVPELSYGDRDTNNMLIQGDNLDALKALLPYYAGQIKCIYIDPPYNTGSAFEHYDDNVEHSTWLGLMWTRLELLRELLSPDGSIWIQLDDQELHYCKIIADEIFGRESFISSIQWQKVFAKKNKAQISGSHDTILVYSKAGKKWIRNLLPRNEKQLSAFKNRDDDARGAWQSVSYTVQSEDSEKRKDYRYEITLPSGDKVTPPAGRHWGGIASKTEKLRSDNRLWFGPKGDKAPRVKVFLTEVQGGIVPDTWWKHEETGNNQEAKKEALAFNLKGEPFATPKPERLIHRILSISTKPGDWVLDSFLGSGTTAAVAHKMNRKFIGIEMGEHAKTHCKPRMIQVIEGEQGGISQSVQWNGGGGFRFFKLGPSVFDDTGQIRPEIEFSILASHIWFYEVGFPWDKPNTLSPILGRHEGQFYALLYNGILGDKRVNGGNVLTRQTLKIIRAEMDDKTLPIVIYGERSALSESSLKRENITFKQTPYDVKARA